MKLLSSRWDVGLAVFIAVSLLCISALILTNHLKSDSSAQSTPAAEHAYQIEKGASGNGHQASVSYQAISMEDAKSVDKKPVNAELLTMLLLIGFSGAILGLLKRSRQWYRDITCIAGRRTRSFLSGRGQVSPAAFLAVFRL